MTAMISGEMSLAARSAGMLAGAREGVAGADFAAGFLNDDMCSGFGGNAAAMPRPMAATKTIKATVPRITQPIALQEAAKNNMVVIKRIYAPRYRNLSKSSIGDLLKSG